MITAIATAFATGGIWMWAILAVQIASVVIIIERVMGLYVLRSKNQTALLKEFEQDIKSGNLDVVVRKANSLSKKSPVAKVVAAGAQAALSLGGKEEIQAQMDEVLINETAKLEKRTGLLAMLGNTGTLLGLLGTIVGLIAAFDSVASVNAQQKGEMLTQGISMAMNTTAYGLIMAIPALVAFGLLQSRTNDLLTDLNKASLKAYNWMSFKYEYIPSRTPRKRVSSVK